MKEDEKQTFDHLPTAEELLRAYASSDEVDTASIYYKRNNVRPKLNLWRVLLYALIVLCVSTVISLFIYDTSKSILWAILTGIFVILGVIIIFIKRVFVWLVKLYQRVAPDSVRNRCRFEPSCSQYMILAIEKYGFFKGVKKGWDRLKRCVPPNSGYDLP